MNKLICTLVTASVLVGGSAYGQNKPKPTNDKQSKQALKDSQMDKVTAGASDPTHRREQFNGDLQQHWCRGCEWKRVE